jgi:hypothetical protein
MLSTLVDHRIEHDAAKYPRGSLWSYTINGKCCFPFGLFRRSSSQFLTFVSAEVDAFNMHSAVI